MAAGNPSPARPVELTFLDDLLGHLKANGYEIDTRQYIALTDLLLLLIAGGRKLDGEIKTLIAPVICSTPEEQKDFYQRFDRRYEIWFPAVSATPAPGQPAPALESPARGWRLPAIEVSSILRLRLLAVIVVLALVALAGWVLSRLTTALAGISFSSPVLYGLGLSVLAGLLLWSLWTLYRDQQFITRGLADETPVHQKVPVHQYLQDVIPAMQFKPVVKALRKRIQAPSTEVDIHRTIENAISHNKWLEFIFRRRQLMPEYFVLVDRKNQQDQQARFVEEVLQRLRHEGVWLHPYEFSDDPRLCFPLGRKDLPLRLQDLQTHYPEARALVVCGTNELIDPNDGSVREWIDQLSFWNDRAILTPDEIHRELAENLKELGVAIVPFALEYLVPLVTFFESQKQFPRKEQRPLPDPLIERPRRWLGRTPAPEEEIDELLNDLRFRYLDKNGFYWLCALAVYPELRWEITLYLGEKLMDEQGKPLMQTDVLLRLARLPWLRYGYLPDWMRIRLINSLDREQNQRTRAALASLFDPDRQEGEFALEIAREIPRSRLSQLKKLIAARFHRAKTGTPERDYIFVKFITGRENQKLSVLLPHPLRQLFAPLSALGSGTLAQVANLLVGLLRDWIRDDQTDILEEEWRLQWQERLFEAIAGLGEEGLAAVQYLREHKTKLRFQQMSASVGATWTLSGEIVLNSRYYTYETPLTDLRFQTLIVHQARRLQQDWQTALSVYGELDAWQTEFRVYHRVRGSYPHPAVAELMDLPLAHDREILRKAVVLMQAYTGKAYRVDLLPLYPLGKEIRYALFKTDFSKFASTPTARGAAARSDLAAVTFSSDLIPGTASEAYSDRMAWLLAGMSQLAYRQFEDGEEALASFLNTLSEAGFRLLTSFHSAETDTHAFLATNGTYQVLVFRGNRVESKRNIQTDIQAALIKTLEGKVHTGFLRAYESIQPALERALTDLPVLPLYLTGHGLGAALATIATQRLERLRPEGSTICYTFGSPRIGNYNFTKGFRSPIYRVVNTTDIVTLIPLTAMGYIHVGDIRYLTRNGEVHRGIPFIDRMLAFLLAMLRSFGPWIADHAITEYRRKLEMIASRRAGLLEN